MATQIETLTVQLEASTKRFEAGMAKASAATDAQMNRIERRLERMSQTTARQMGNIVGGLNGQLAKLGVGLGAAFSTREILQYADAWTAAKNSLAVAGVVGAQQVTVLNRLFQSAQANAAPVGALADLFGKASQASDVLGASQGDLLKFTDGVATALRIEGKSAASASGALTQLSQLLGAGTVRAEEFNSVNEGARPILMAVANGMDAAGGSVSKLRDMVIAGQVSSKQFFDAFLRGLPTIQSMAANATQTIGQGITKVQNALTKYIGETDSSLGASRRLVQALNTLADNFGATADVVLRLAGVIGGALAGRAIVGMIAQFGAGAAAVARFVASLRTLSTVSGVTAAITGLGVAAGPVGLVIGGAVVGAMTLFASSSDAAGEGAARFEARLRKLKEAADAAAPAVEQLVAGPAAEQWALTQEVAAAEKQIRAARDALVDFLDSFTDGRRPNWIISPEQRESVVDLRNRVADGTIEAKAAREELTRLGNVSPGFQPYIAQANALAAALGQLAAAGRQANAELAAGQAGSYGVSGSVHSGQVNDALKPGLIAGQDFKAQEDLRNSYSARRLREEQTRAKILKEAGDNAIFTEQQLGEMVRARIAAEDRRSAEGRRGGRGGGADKSSAWKDEVKSLAEREAGYSREQAALSLTAFEAAKAEAAFQLLAAAKKDNLKVTVDLERDVERLATSYARAKVSLDEAKTSQEQFNELQRFAGQTMSGFFSDIVSGGKNAQEAVMNLTKKLAEAALQAALLGEGPLASILGGGKGGKGIIGSIFSAIFGGGVAKAEGGFVSGPGSGRSDSIPARLSNGEFVINAAATKRHRAMLEAINSGRAPGFADGGLVRGMPSLPSPRDFAGRAGGDIHISNTFTLDARGATTDSLPALRAEMAAMKRELPSRIIAAVNDGRRRGSLA